jgi:hypothetical protein
MNKCPCRDLNRGPSWLKESALPTELSTTDCNFHLKEMWFNWKNLRSLPGLTITPWRKMYSSWERNLYKYQTSFWAVFWRCWKSLTQGPTLILFIRRLQFSIYWEWSKKMAGAIYSGYPKFYTTTFLSFFTIFFNIWHSSFNIQHFPKKFTQFNIWDSAFSNQCWKKLFCAQIFYLVVLFLVFLSKCSVFSQACSTVLDTSQKQVLF